MRDSADKSLEGGFTMPSILIRDVPASTRENIVAAALAAGRSMQKELLATIQEKYGTSVRQNLVDILLSAGSLEDDEEFVLLRDTPVRDFSFGDED